MTTELAKYTIVKGLSLILLKGSVVHFEGKIDNAAIVNAANSGVLGGGGVDGAISAAGGHRLYEDRLQLPVLEKDGDYEVRCRVGSAVVTGPGDYGELQVPYVIHAVGPNYNGFDEDEYEQAHELLKSAYSTTLDVAADSRLGQVAFSLLSAGIFRGFCTLEEVLGLGVETIVTWGEAKPEDCSVSEIYLVAFSARECITLKKVCDKAFGVKSEEEEQDSNGAEMKIDTTIAAVSSTTVMSKDEDEDEEMKVDATEPETAPNTADVAEDEQEKKPEGEIVKVDSPKAETAPDGTALLEDENEKETTYRCIEKAPSVDISEKEESGNIISEEPPVEHDKNDSRGKEAPLGVANSTDMEKSESTLLDNPSGELDATEKSAMAALTTDIAAPEVSGKPEEKLVETTTTSATAATSGSDSAEKSVDPTDSKKQDGPGEGGKTDAAS